MGRLRGRRVGPPREQAARLCPLARRWAPLARRGHCVVVGNVGILPGGFSILPGASLQDGSLDVGILAPQHVLGWAVMARRSWPTATTSTANSSTTGPARWR